MPRIFNIIETGLLPALKRILLVSERADFCAGCFNLHGWKQPGSHVENWTGGPGVPRFLLAGMQWLSQDGLAPEEIVPFSCFGQFNSN